MSEKMSPWRLGNDYDRPIAHRIAEELGHVPRHLFGQRKLAPLRCRGCLSMQSCGANISNSCGSIAWFRSFGRWPIAGFIESTLEFITDDFDITVTHTTSAELYSKWLVATYLFRYCRRTLTVVFIVLCQQAGRRI
jgi:hypothetical protein